MFPRRGSKKDLELPKQYSNTAESIALGFPPFMWWLSFLPTVITNEESICHRAFSTMVDYMYVEALGLVRKCREREERYKSSFTS